jgi:hypothetical protein
MQRKRGEYVVPGPNAVWSTDGYDKLKPYGVEIYACVDAYARYIVWIYIGISNATAVSSYTQFLDVVGKKGIMPAKIRSDRGRETTLMGQVFFELSQEAFRRDTGSHTAEPLEFRDCYIYGTGPANQRIESWWLQLTRGHIFRFRNFFMSLAKQGLFVKSNLHDRIALLAVYMPVLRNEVANFVTTWNSHRIRRQRGRPNCVSGVPYQLYHYPQQQGAADYSVAVPELMRQQFARGTEDWDIDAYLPNETLEWCRKSMAEVDFDPEAPPPVPHTEIEKPYCMVYMHLREAIFQHIVSAVEPTLGILASPTGARNWIANNLPQSVDIDNILEEDFGLEDAEYDADPFELTSEMYESLQVIE